MLAVLSISRLLKKDSGLRIWVTMMMAKLLIKRAKLFGNHDQAAIV